MREKHGNFSNVVNSEVKELTTSEKILTKKVEDQQVSAPEVQQQISPASVVVLTTGTFASSPCRVN